MKRIALAVAVVVSALAVPAGAQASLRSQVRTLQREVKSLQSAVKADTKYVDALKACVAEAPLTDYGDSAGTFGYVYDLGGGNYIDTTALDQTAAGDDVSFWLLGDACNSQVTASATTASIRSSAARGAFAPLAQEYSLPLVSHRR
jgi:hypothetical protein